MKAQARIVDWRTVPADAVWCIGQHTASQRRELDKRTKRGELVKVRAHWMGISNLKTVYVRVA